MLYSKEQTQTPFVALSENMAQQNLSPIPKPNSTQQAVNIQLGPNSFKHSLESKSSLNSSIQTL